jgi:hypothetical protein
MIVINHLRNTIWVPALPVMATPTIGMIMFSIMLGCMIVKPVTSQKENTFLVNAATVTQKKPGFRRISNILDTQSISAAPAIKRMPLPITIPIRAVTAITRSPGLKSTLITPD